MVQKETKKVENRRGTPIYHIGIIGCALKYILLSYYIKLSLRIKLRRNKAHHTLLNGVLR